jgi:hypothetical protein
MAVGFKDVAELEAGIAFLRQSPTSSLGHKSKAKNLDGVGGEFMKIRVYLPGKRNTSTVS